MNARQAPNPWLRVFLPFAAGYYLSYFLRNVNAVIAPELTRELGIGAADLGLLTSAYLIAFGAFQLPLGILLDRFGPRRVEAALLIVAAAGCAAFGLGDGLTGLAAGRALIGLGVSACLMAAFKAFSLWFPAERQASLNAAIMAAGGLGALTASTPLGLLLPLTGWRGIFFGLAGLAVLAAVAIFTTPDKPTAAARESLGDQLRGLRQVLASRIFWRIAPQTAMIVGGFIALQGLWAVPWLINVNGYSRDAAAFHLLLMSAAMLVGFLSIATFVTGLVRRGIPAERILMTGLGLGLLDMLAIVLDLAPSHVLWFVFGLVFSVGNLSYAILTGRFPATLSGRVNTALNLAVFIGAFALQWGVGLAVDGLQAAGMTAPQAFRATFAGVLALQAACYGWYLVSGEKGGSPVTARG